MYSHHHTANALIFLSAAFALSACSGARMGPVHEGKFMFDGVVKDESGKPVTNAWIKVRGWETLTDEKGHWHQEQVVDCGTLREHAGEFEETNDVLIEAPGFVSAEEHFFVKHPGYFQSCEADQKVLFNTVLKSEAREGHQSSEAPKFKPRDEPPTVPAPSTRNTNKGGYTL